MEALEEDEKANRGGQEGDSDSSESSSSDDTVESNSEGEGRQEEASAAVFAVRTSQLTEPTPLGDIPHGCLFRSKKWSTVHLQREYIMEDDDAKWWSLVQTRCGVKLSPDQYEALVFKEWPISMRKCGTCFKNFR